MLTFLFYKETLSRRFLLTRKRTSLINDDKKNLSNLNLHSSVHRLGRRGHDAARMFPSCRSNEWKHSESRQMQTDRAHLHGWCHTPPGLRRHSSTRQMTQSHLTRASRRDWSRRGTETRQIKERKPVTTTNKVT